MVFGERRERRDGVYGNTLCYTSIARNMSYDWQNKASAPTFESKETELPPRVEASIFGPKPGTWKNFFHLSPKERRYTFWLIGWTSIEH